MISRLAKAALAAPAAAAAAYLCATITKTNNSSIINRFGFGEKVVWLEGSTNAPLGPDCHNPVCSDKITNFRAMSV